MLCVDADRDAASGGGSGGGGGGALLPRGLAGWALVYAGVLCGACALHLALVQVSRSWSGSGGAVQRSEEGVAWPERASRAFSLMML